MTWLDDIVRDTVDTVLGLLTTTAVLVRQTDGAFDPFDEVNTTPTETNTTFKSSPALAYKNHEVDNELILRGDMMVLLSPKGQTVVPTPETDHVTQGGTRYRLIAVEIVSGGTLAGLYKCQLRKN